MGVRARGVSQIKTLSAVRGGGVHSNERHMHQFKIASLELEKSRRGRERQAVMNRIKNVEARLLEIDALIRQNQQALNVTNGANDDPLPATKAGANAAANGKRRTLRY